MWRRKFGIKMLGNAFFGHSKPPRVETRTGRVELLFFDWARISRHEVDHNGRNTNGAFKHCAICGHKTLVGTTGMYLHEE